MKKILVTVYKKCFELKNQILWRLECKKISKRIKYANNIKELNTENKSIILIPHSDDEWVGCSQIIEDKNSKTILCNLNMQGNDSDNIHKVRYNELKNTSIKYDKELITIKSEKVTKLKEIIDETKPKMIFVPSFIDWHEEHQEVINILYNAIKEIKNEFDIVMYQVSVPIHYKFVNYAIPMAKAQLKNKWKYFRNNYKTQKYFPYKRFMLNEKINGRILNTFASEVYITLSKNEWKDIKEIINNSEISKLKNNLQSISKMRKESEELYEKYFAKENRNNDIS